MTVTRVSPLVGPTDGLTPLIAGAAIGYVSGLDRCPLIVTDTVIELALPPRASELNVMDD